MVEGAATSKSDVGAYIGVEVACLMGVADGASRSPPSIDAVVSEHDHPVYELEQFGGLWRSG
jgi:hypothetical protein